MTAGDRERKPLGWEQGVWLLLLAVAIMGLVSVSSGCGGGESASHIDESSGSTNGVEPDERKGIAPPAVKVTNLQKAAEQAGCYLELHLEDEGHKHLPPESPEPHYETDPPTSGPHVEPSHRQADGAYLEMPEPTDFVASLDHGRMAIQYAPDFPEELQEEVKGLYDTMYGGTLLFPNNSMNFAIAATTWTNRLACTGWNGTITLDAIRDFGRATWGKYGDEPVEAGDISGPTPVHREEAK